MTTMIAEGQQTEFIQLKLNEYRKQQHSLNDIVVSSYLCKQERILQLPIVKDINTLIFQYYNYSFSTNSKELKRILSKGQIFYKYVGKRRRKPQDRNIKVYFGRYGKPTEIHWGATPGEIYFDDIKYIASGLWTKVFQSRKDDLAQEAHLCFSIVGKHRILDLKAETKEIAEFWVNSLRILLGHDQTLSDRLYKEGWESMMESENDVKHRNTVNNTQDELFKMIFHTTVKKLRDDGTLKDEHDVTQSLDINALYNKALKENISWRQWRSWVRNEIMDHFQIKDADNNAYYGTALTTNIGGNLSHMHQNETTADSEECIIM